MALGDLAKSDDSSFATTQSFDLGSNPTSGNILVIYSGVAGIHGLTTAPSGFTQALLQTGTGSITAGVWYKISGGTEQTAEVVWDGGFGVGTYVEIDFDSNSLATFQSNDDDTNLSVAATSQDTGAVTTDQATNVVLVGVYIPNESNCDGGQAWTGTETVHRAVADAGQAGWGIAGFTDQSGSTEFTFSTTDTGDQMWGNILVFNYTAAGTLTVAVSDVTESSAVLLGVA